MKFVFSLEGTEIPLTGTNGVRASLEKLFPKKTIIESLVGGTVTLESLDFVAGDARTIHSAFKIQSEVEVIPTTFTDFHPFRRDPNSKFLHPPP